MLQQALVSADVTGQYSIVFQKSLLKRYHQIGKKGALKRLLAIEKITNILF